MTVSILVATTGRPTLERTLASITPQLRPGDQVIVIGATPEIGARAARAGCTFVQAPMGRDWGASERAVGLQHATGDYVSFMDDDDVYLHGAREAMETAMTAHLGKPTIFRMRIARTGELLWRQPIAKMGNMGTPMMFLPTPVAKKGRWGRRYGNDFEYWTSMNWSPDAIAWSDTVIADIRPLYGLPIP